jgi:hypothetical protein
MIDGHLLCMNRAPPSYDMVRPVNAASSIPSASSVTSTAVAPSSSLSSSTASTSSSLPSFASLMNHSSPSNGNDNDDVGCVPITSLSLPSHAIALTTAAAASAAVGGGGHRMATIKRLNVASAAPPSDDDNHSLLDVQSEHTIINMDTHHDNGTNDTNINANNGHSHGHGGNGDVHDDSELEEGRFGEGNARTYHPNANLIMRSQQRGIVYHTPHIISCYLVCHPHNHNIGDIGDDIWCGFCQSMKPMRSKHCHKCKRCIVKFDHHCPFIGTSSLHPTPHVLLLLPGRAANDFMTDNDNDIIANCVGGMNHRLFWWYLFWQNIANIWCWLQVYY